jgi:hypothetical protein
LIFLSSLSEADAKETETPETTAPVSTRSRKKAKKQQKQQQQVDQQSAEVNGDADDVNVISVKICDDLAYISFLNQNQQNFFTVNVSIWVESVEMKCWIY